MTRSVVSVALAAAVVMVACGTFAGDADTCTYDFAAISRAKFADNDSATPNLLADPLGFKKSQVYAWRPDKGVDLPTTNERIDKAIVAEAVREDGLFSMLSPESLVEICGGEEKAACLHNFAGMKAKAPPPGKYRFSCRYRANHVVGNASWNAYFGIRDDRNREVMMVNLPDTGDDSDYWFTRTKEFVVPEGATRLHLFLRFDGVGYMKLSGMKIASVVENPDEREPEVLYRVKGSYDGRFGVNEHDVEAIKIDWRTGRNHNLNWWKTGVEFVVPEGFGFVGFNGRVERVERRADGTTLVRGGTVQPSGGVRVYPLAKFVDSNSLSLLVRAERAAGTAGRLTWQALYEGRRVGETGSLELETVPAMQVTLPKRYAAGAMLTYSLQFFPGQPEANRAYAEHLRRCGVDWIMPELRWMKFDPSLLPMWRKTGFRYITPTANDYFCDGYAVPLTADRPAEDKFVKRPGKPEHYMFKLSSCPAAIYEERPFFMTNFVASIARWAKGTDGMWSNWEPFYYGGCHCAGCLARLADWTKKTGDGEQHFHSMQHGRICKTIQRHFKRIFGEDSPAFMPAICFSEVTSYGRLADYPADKLAKDYVGDMNWLPAWGPYVAWEPEKTGAWVSNRGRNVAAFIAAREVREEIDRNYPGRRPKIIFQPAGGNWTIQPEWLEVSMDAGFFNRIEACVPWVMPEGCDARLWAGFTRHVNRAARYERAVWEGTRNDAATEIAPKPGFEQTCPKPIAHYLPTLKQYFNYGTLRQTTYDLEGTRYVAVLNFNDERHVEFTLRTVGLAPGRYEVVREDGARPCGGRPLTAEELAAGVGLSVPVSSTRVFEIRARR